MAKQTHGIFTLGCGGRAANRRMRLFSGLLIWAVQLPALASTFWTDTPIGFTKQNGADWTLPANQDRITDKVWLTRANIAGLFNAVSETSYQSSSPADTEWALGSIADGVASLTFSNWVTAVNENPPDAVNKDLVLHLISDDIYIDLKFLSWQPGRTGSGGGGFSYVRASAPSAVPLPASIALFGSGLLAFSRRRAG